MTIGVFVGCAAIQPNSDIDFGRLTDQIKITSNILLCYCAAVHEFSGKPKVKLLAASIVFNQLNYTIKVLIFLTLTPMAL